MKISANQRRVLEVFAENYSSGFGALLFYDHIAAWTGLDRSVARIATRALKRKGLVELSSCFDDDGMIRGSGHMATKAGYDLISADQVGQ